MNRRRLLAGIPLLLLMVALPWVIHPAFAGPGAVPDAPLYPNGRPTYYANSPAGLTPIMNPATGLTASTSSGTALAKFVDSLAGLGLPGCVTGTVGANLCHENNLGNYIPIATADTATFPGSDYYVIGLKDYRQRMHSNLLAPVDALGTGVKLRGYYEIKAGVPQANHYLGPVILATKDRPVRILFQNNIASGAAGLFLPTDPTVMGAGLGPDGINSYSQNRAVVHLHGGHTPWISDGTPHQWITPAGDLSPFKKGLAFQNVPDMVGAGKPIVAPSLTDGLATYYWTNQQSGRLLFYHDHSHGITRLNVYAGEAAGYLIVDPQESVMMTAGTLPDICDPAVNGGLCAYKYGIPLVIQDKTFVPANVGGTASLVGGQDTLWNIATWGGEGNLWFPHVYEKNQDLAAATGLNPAGRWDYGPYVWPPSPVTNPTLPPVSLTPEAFMDTPIVNGTAYPYLPVEKKAYRFRILSAANDRSFNLQLYYGATAAGVACNAVTPVPYASCTEVNMVPAVPRPACSSTAPVVLTNCVCSAGVGNSPAGCFPATYPVDGRDSGVPDPALAGPQMTLIGSESGFLPAPVVLPNHPITFDPVGNIAQKTLLLMPAERGDVIVDFTNAPLGSTIILYNDAPAALPGGDPRYDYYTGNPSQILSGGAPSTLAGFGPNMRTIMQFRVTTLANTAPVITATNLAGLSAAAPAVGALATAYAASQPAHIVPAGTYAKLTDTAMAVNGASTPFKGKSINEGFDSTYGRINAMLGTEAPSGLNPSVPLDYAAPATEILRDGQVQLWKITHNGIDSHPIHFHLEDVQVVNRIGWNGEIKPPDPSEAGWKETVRMNPLEDIIVAMRPTAPVLSFTIPNSVRPLDPTLAVNTLLTFPDPVTGVPTTYPNAMTNFGNEYAWHCHILGHEEFDLMRPVILNVDQLLYTSFATGIQQWDMGNWSQLNTLAPASMVASASTLYAYGLTGAPGVFKWDGTTWSQLNATNPTGMVASGSMLYVKGIAGAPGVWQWNGTAWRQLNALDPANMVASGSTLYVNGLTGAPGVWQWNGTAWSQLNSLNPTGMVASGSTLYAYGLTGAPGVWKWSGTAWSQLNTNNPTGMVASGSMLYVKGIAGAPGVWQWNGTAWSQLNALDPVNMAAAGSTLYVNGLTGAPGVFKWNGTAWSQLNTINPTGMAAVGSQLYVDGLAGAPGVWKWDGTAWSQLNPTDPAIMVAGF